MIVSEKISASRRLGGSTLLFCGLIILFSAGLVAQVPSPQSVLGFRPTDDRTIADWTQITNYFSRLDAASNKVAVREIGKTTLGKPLIVAFISSPDNIKNLERHRRTSAKLADPRTIKDAAELESLVRNGKTIVSISCSLHSTEIVASQMSMNLAYELATAADDDTKEILENTILLLIPSSNPDGIDIVANWYRKTLGTKSEGTAPPELYHHYAGHDNNRDWFMLNLAESQAITKLFWQEWFPQIVYDVHQTGQNGARLVIPPFYDPPNPRIPPSILREVGLVGYKMAADLQAKNIAGVATNTTFDTWWHGGFRTAPYYHNSIGILSEAASADLMTPVTITREQMQRNPPARGLPSPLATDTAHPDAWEGGQWRPRDIAEIEMTASRALLSLAAKYRPRYLRNFHDISKANLKHDPNVPQAYVVMAGQPRAETVSRFLEILMWQGIEVYEMTNELFVKHRRTEDFHEIPLGSFLVFLNQTQKNNVLSLFERQVYPNRVNEKGEAERPYDVAGWTLPLQMGVESYEVWDIRDLEKYRNTLKRVASHNQSRAIMNLPAASAPFSKLTNPLKTSPRIGLYKPFVSSMDEGWTRYVFDNHQIPYSSISNDDFRAGRLNYDVIILPADGENAIMNGLNANRYPAEFAGGIGDAGIVNLKKFVESGGKLICFDNSCELVIKRLGLPLRNVLNGLPRNQFYNPGSIVKLNVDTRHPYALGMLEETPAYFITSSAFELVPPGKAESVNRQASDLRVIARYAEKDALMSGWMLGERLINGKTAFAEVSYGRGKVVLFAFRPQHRGQTFATFPFIFNALEK
ncbi:MAG TPA: M14 family metallopeptidase [Pyrinomonadaceae bacterium]|nr:M14 family metallopeptidase [Pyrinomonadaceae bacterium]